MDIERESLTTVETFMQGQVVGHIPYNLAPTVELFLRREVNKRFVELNGARVNGLAIAWKLRIVLTYFFINPTFSMIDNR